MASNRNYGLKRSSEFAHLKLVGNKVRPCPWILLVYTSNDFGYLRFGVTIPKQVGNAVIRNKLRRWTREAFRLKIKNEQALGVDVNVIFRPQPDRFYRSVKSTIFKDNIDKAWKRIQHSLASNS